MARSKLTAAPRELTGKKVKQMRRSGQVPAAVFGPNRPSVSVSVDEKSFATVFTKAGYSSLVDFQIEGEAKPVQVTIKEVQRHPVSRAYQHIAFYQVDANREMTAEIPIVLLGESLAVKNNVGFLSTPTKTLTIRCLPADLPAHLEIDISGLNEIGDTITIGDIKLPEGVELDSSMQPSTAVAAIAAPQLLVEEEKPAEESDETAGGAEAGGETTEGGTPDTKESQAE